MVDLAVIIPTYNEHETIGALLRDLLTAFPLVRILVVDDFSPDRTADVVRSFADEHANVRLMSRPSKDGLGSAYRDGVASALRMWSPERVVFMDADGSHSVCCLRRIVASAADVVVGSRYVADGHVVGWPLWRHVLSRGGNAYARIVTGLRARDVTSGFMCIKRACLESLDLERCDARGYAFLMQVKFEAVAAGAILDEVPITFVERRLGMSKISLAIVLEGLAMPLRLRLGQRSARRVLPAPAR
jgi:dolichol-phosphate mannosyltransferase